MTMFSPTAGACPLLVAIVKTEVLDDWYKENILWPGLTLLLATCAYSGTILILQYQLGLTGYLGGDLVGPGGAFLLVVMAASVGARTKVLCRQLASLSITQGGNAEHYVAKLWNVGQHNVVLQAAAIAIGIALAILQAFIEHSLVGITRVIATVLVLSGNAMLIAACVNYFWSQLYECKFLLMTLVLIEGGAGDKVVTCFHAKWRSKSK